jgi:hypothetical protein
MKQKFLNGAQDWRAKDEFLSLEKFGHLVSKVE